MKFINFSVVKFASLLTVGILIAHFFLSPSLLYFYLFSGFVFLIFIAWFIARKQLFQNSLFGIITYLSFALLGIISYQIRLSELIPDHYSHQISNSSTSETYQLKIKEVLKTDTYNDKYITDVIAINQKVTKGRVLLNIKKDSLKSLLNIDDILLISAPLHLINSPLNPHQFDYSKYMKTMGIQHQLRVSNPDILYKYQGKTTLKSKAEKLRNHIINKLKDSFLTPNELSIIQALILG